MKLYGVTIFGPDIGIKWQKPSRAGDGQKMLRREIHGVMHHESIFLSLSLSSFSFSLSPLCITIISQNRLEFCQHVILFYLQVCLLVTFLFLLPPSHKLVSGSIVSSSYDPRDFRPPVTLSVGFPRQENWSGLLFLSPGDLSDPRIEPRSPALKADSLWTEPPGSDRPF